MYLVGIIYQNTIQYAFVNTQIKTNLTVINK
jgi:hypothetical protein